ncbi:hypothetical protein ACFTAO_50145 [Paenibacillus rhizoplanae]
MAAQLVSGISPVQATTAYGSTQSDVSSLEKQRNRLLMELDKVNAAQGGEMQTPYRREQLQRQIRQLEAHLVQKKREYRFGFICTCSPASGSHSALAD